MIHTVNGQMRTTDGSGLEHQSGTTSAAVVRSTALPSHGYNDNDLIRTNEFRERFSYFAKTIVKKIEKLQANQMCLPDLFTNARAQLSKHYECAIGQLLAGVRQRTELQLEVDVKSIDDKLHLAMSEALAIKSKLETQKQLYDSLVDALAATYATPNGNCNGNNNATSSSVHNNSNNNNVDDDEFSEMDELMINDSINEFNDLGDTEATNAAPNIPNTTAPHAASSSSSSNSNISGSSSNSTGLVSKQRASIKSRLEDVYSTIETLMKQQMANEPNLINELTAEQLDLADTFRLVRCVPDLEQHCFGHFRKEPCGSSGSSGSGGSGGSGSGASSQGVIAALPPTASQSLVATTAERIDHTHFALKTQLSENFRFRAGQLCVVDFTFPDYGDTTDAQLSTIADYLNVSVSDPRAQPAKFDVVRKITRNQERPAKQQHYCVKISPELAGIYRLDIRYKSVHITGSPFHFAVLPQALVDVAATTTATATASKQPTAILAASAIKSEFNYFQPQQQQQQQQQQQRQQQQSQAPLLLQQQHQQPTKSMENVCTPNALNKTPMAPQAVLATSGGSGGISEVSASSASLMQKISGGRGRLLRFCEERKAAAGSAGFSVQPAPQQKRKSPLSSWQREGADANSTDPAAAAAVLFGDRLDLDEQMDEDVDANNNNNNSTLNSSCSDAHHQQKELSSRFKKAVYVDEGQNCFHTYSNQSISSITSSLNVNTDMQSASALAGGSSSSSGQASIAAASASHHRSLISDHVRKHSGGLVKLIGDKSIPALKAQYVCTFSNCHFPIGIRPYSRRNWLIVCDSSNNAIKVFDSTSAVLLYEIKDNNTGFTLKRPSAVLIDWESSQTTTTTTTNNTATATANASATTTTEMFVKDDKEILVFDLEKDCKFVRKFGLNILHRPYGLAFDASRNVLLVDANVRNPVIYVFDRRTGAVLSHKPYEPVMKSFASQEFLDMLNSSNKMHASLNKQLAPFENTKVRFIAYSQGSLYASDLGRSIVYKTNLTGNIQMAFGFFGKKTGQFCEPSGIHVDHDGDTILIGDSKNDRLQIYDSMGVYKCDVEFLDEKIIRPSDIHVDADGFLYVACFLQKCVKKYRLFSD